MSKRTLSAKERKNDENSVNVVDAFVQTTYHAHPGSSRDQTNPYPRRTCVNR